mmetsp:Transcript_31435/g.75831  ORF Transcript_31435/g.75831 Transcript_31435/m.75831 type:complete len:161 (-) Transcript_31435:3993-4475(-)
MSIFITAEKGPRLGHTARRSIHNILRIIATDTIPPSMVSSPFYCKTAVIFVFARLGSSNRESRLLKPLIDALLLLSSLRLQRSDSGSIPVVHAPRKRTPSNHGTVSLYGQACSYALERIETWSRRLWVLPRCFQSSLRPTELPIQNACKRHHKSICLAWM